MPFYKMRFVAARIFYIPRPNWPHLHLLPAAASARFDDRLKPVEPPTSAAHHVSGSEGRPMADSLRNLFPLHQKRPKGNPKTIGFWRRFYVLLPPRAKGCRAGARNIPAGGNHADAGAARNRRTKNGPSGRQPLRGARPKPRETTRARGAEYLFSILPQKHKRLQRKVSFSRRGSLYLDRRRVSAPLPAACYQLSCVLYWATIRQIGIYEIHIF